MRRAGFHEGNKRRQGVFGDDAFDLLVGPEGDVGETPGSFVLQSWFHMRRQEGHERNQNVCVDHSLDDSLVFYDIL